MITIVLGCIALILRSIGTNLYLTSPMYYLHSLLRSTSLCSIPLSEMFSRARSCTTMKESQ